MWKIIIKNIDKQKCFVYGISIALFSAIIFTITSLFAVNEAINLGGDSESVKIVFFFYYSVILVAGLLFIIYSIRFYVKSRMKDYALLLVLGSSKKNCLLFMEIEFAIIFFVATFFGISLGMTIMKCISMIFMVKYSDVEMSELRRKNIGFVFQDYNLFDSLSVEENIIVPMILEHTSAAEMRRRLNENAELLGIKGILKKYPYEISGGEKQRTAIARALVNNPQIILADEPTGNLDTVSAKIIMEYFAEINYQKKKAVVIVTHDPVVASYAKKIFFIKDGKIIKQIENTSKQQESIHIISNTMLDL